MVEIPLELKLKRQIHKDLARAQDMLVEIVYSLAENAVLHGGTAIWRCYHGNRFSEDLDFYLIPPKDFAERFKNHLRAQNAIIEKYKQTENAIYAKISFNGTTVRFEAALRKPAHSISCTYEKIDGTFIDILTLSPEDLLIEKLTAYQNRMLIRDIYDVYHLGRIASLNKNQTIKIRAALESLPKPNDEKILKTLILSGVAPSYAQMVNEIRRRCVS